MSYYEMKTALQRNRDKLLARKNVVAVGIGRKMVDGKPTDTLAIVCSVSKKVPLAALAKADVVPSTVEGAITDVVQTGPIKALKARTDRWRPAPGGVSIGHEWITAGTLGCLVRKAGELYILSNNHVLADSNNAPIGGAILQPGKYDGGTLIDRIAVLSEFIKIEWIGGDFQCPIGNSVAGLGSLAAKLLGSKTRLQAFSTRQVENLVDAAIAKPIDDADVEEIIYQIGAPMGINLDPILGLAVKKSGRTTGVTTGTIDQVDVAVQVQYGEGKMALFVDQLLVAKEGFCSGGDSGSAVLDVNKRLVGLLFAGGDNTTIINRIGHVWNLLALDTGLEG